jgi:hypothetical protein
MPSGAQNYDVVVVGVGGLGRLAAWRSLTCPSVGCWQH